MDTALVSLLNTGAFGASDSNEHFAPPCVSGDRGSTGCGKALEEAAAKPPHTVDDNRGQAELAVAFTWRKRQLPGQLIGHTAVVLDHCLLTINSIFVALLLLAALGGEGHYLGKPQIAQRDAVHDGRA